MHTQVFSTSCPGMFQWSLSRVLMWVEEKWKNLEENESQGMRKPRSRWQIFKKKRREGLQSIAERIYWRSEEGLTWWHDGNNRVNKGQKKMAGVFSSRVSHISFCFEEWAQKKGALSRFYVAFWKQNKPSTEQYIQPQNFSDMSALIFPTSQVLPVKHPVWYPLWSLFSLVDIP